MALNRQLVLYSIVAYILLSFYAAYFKFFPTIVSSGFSNFLIIAVLTVLLGILVLEPFQLKTTNELYLVLPHYILFAFITRVLPTLRFTYQPLSDPYHYSICTLNIVDYGTLDPVLSWWYGQVQQQLTWPNLHLVGSFLMDLTGIHSIEFLRYVAPMGGTLFFLGVFLLAKEVTGNIKIALLAGLFAATGDSVIFYQSEYHPQGLAFVYFVFMIALLVRYFSRPTPMNGFLAIMCTIVFSLSHHFSSIFIGLLSAFIIFYIVFFDKKLSERFAFKNSRPLQKLLVLWIIIAVTAFFNHIFTYPAFWTIIRKTLDKSEVSPRGALLTMGSQVPLQVSFLNSMKYCLLLLGIISILYIYRSRNKKEFLCFLIVIGVVIAGVVGTFIAFIPVDRLIGFYIPIIALFAALTVYRFYNDWFVHWSKQLKLIIILGVSLMILLAGPLNFYAPALIFHDSSSNPYYWHSNDFSGFSTYGVPGDWIKDYTLQRSIFTIYNNLDMIPYFYGQNPGIYGQNPGDQGHQNIVYSIFNVNFMRQQTLKNPESEIATTNLIYTSGRHGISING